MVTVIWPLLSAMVNKIDFFFFFFFWTPYWELGHLLSHIAWDRFLWSLLVATLRRLLAEEIPRKFSGRLLLFPPILYSQIDWLTTLALTREQSKAKQRRRRRQTQPEEDSIERSILFFF